MLSLSTHKNGESWSGICRDLDNAACIISITIGRRVLPSGLELLDDSRLKDEIALLSREYRSSPSYASFYEPVLELLSELSSYLPLIRGRSDYLLLFTNEVLEAEWGSRVQTAYEVFLYIANIRRRQEGSIPLKGICVDFSEKKGGCAYECSKET